MAQTVTFIFIGIPIIFVGLLLGLIVSSWIGEQLWPGSGNYVDASRMRRRTRSKLKLDRSSPFNAPTQRIAKKSIPAGRRDVRDWRRR
jgi:hypothetical protein